jgi:hypothetical protein
LDDAIEQQIANQRQFVEWWDENVGVRHGSGQGEAGLKNAELRSLMSVAKAEELTGISQQKVSRWRKCLEDVGAYRTALRGPSYRASMASDMDDNTQQYRQHDNTNDNTNDTSGAGAENSADAPPHVDNTNYTSGASGTNVSGAPPHVDNTSNTDYIDDNYGRNIRGTAGTGEFERYTPAKYIEIARTVMGTIDVDPASCEMAQKIVKATTFFTVKDDGLNKEWIGNIWLNPPYHRGLGPKFIDKLVI